MKVDLEYSPIQSLSKWGGIHAGHTRFLSGQHGDGWIEKGEIISRPKCLEEIAQALASKASATFGKLDVVIGSAQCGAVLASRVAYFLDVRLALCSRNPLGDFSFHRMNNPKEGSRGLLVDDLIFSGRDARDIAGFAKEQNLDFLGVLAWMKRDFANLSGVNVYTLVGTHPFKTFSPEDCPLCHRGDLLEWIDVRE